MKRKENWPQALNNFVAVNAVRPLVFGEFDCCLFAAGAVEAMTGVDPAAEFRGTYTNEIEAARVLNSISPDGIPGMLDAMAAKYGWERVENNRYAQRGDIALARPEITDGPAAFGGALGVCIGTLTVFLRGDRLIGLSTIEAPGAPVDFPAFWRIPLGRD